MAKYKVGDIFINHNDGKILQVYEGKDGCTECAYKKRLGICSYGSYQCRKQIGNYPHFKELPFLPTGTKVKMREDLKLGTKYGSITFATTMAQYKEITIKDYFASFGCYIIYENEYNYSFEMFDQVINEPKENNMETKEFKINIPEGYEIDKENSTFECIKFKPVKKELTYEDVAEELFGDTCYFINRRGKSVFTKELTVKENKNNATNKKQLERLLALNQLLNIAKYYNKKSPKEKETVYCINFDKIYFKYFISSCTDSMFVRGLISTFNNKEDAEAVINNPNFKDILDLIYKCDED